MKTILAPVDFSEVTERVVEEAVRLAAAFGGYVFLLHVSRPPAAVFDYPIDVGMVADVTAAIEKSADEQLAILAGQLQSRGTAVQSLRVNGWPTTDILEQAKTLRADYIVLGSHGHTAFYDLVAGSTASAVIRKSLCPVLIVPPRPVTAVASRGQPSSL